jgi:hypothetical protein
VLQGHQGHTDPHQLDIHPAGEYHSVALHMAVPLTIREVSAIPECELAGLLAHVQAVGALDLMVAVLEAEDSQEEVGEVEDDAPGFNTPVIELSNKSFGHATAIEPVDRFNTNDSCLNSTASDLFVSTSSSPKLLIEACIDICSQRGAEISLWSS